MPVRYKPSRAVIWAVVSHGVLAVLLASRLPTDAWFVSDPGARLVAARAVIDHPSRPFEIGNPGLSTSQAAEIPQPYFSAHGDHAHAIAPPLFPLAVAPFVALFGLSGLAVLPIAAWIAIGPLASRLAVRLGAEVKAWVVLFASIVATPFVFYGLEFWEHAPAVACVLAGAVLALEDRHRFISRAAGGAFWMLAFQLRPEMAPAVLAAAVVVALRRSSRSLAVPVMAAAIVAAPFAIYNLAHFGRPTSPHVAINLALLGDRWWAERVHDARMWFGTANPITIAGFGLIGIGWLGAIAKRRIAGATLALGGAMLIALAAAMGHEPHHAFFRAFPVGVLAVIPFVSWTSATRDLVILAALPLVGCWITAPNDGGGQWGARYLLATVPPMLLLGLQNLSQLVRVRTVFVAAGIWLLLAGLIVSRSGYQELRGAKRYYSRLVGTTATHLGDAPHLLTDAWWVPAAHAAVIDYRKTAVIRTPAEATRVLSSLEARDVLAVTDNPATSLVEWTQGTCYRASLERQSADGRLRYARLSCLAR